MAGKGISRESRAGRIVGALARTDANGQPAAAPQSRPGDRHVGSQTTFWLPPALKDWLKQHAADTGRTMTDVVVDALERERDAKPGCRPE